MYLYASNEHQKYVDNLPNITKKFLLSGPPGSEIYQENLIKALAKQFNSKLFIMSSNLFSFDSISNINNNINNNNGMKEIPKRKLVNYSKSIPKSKFPSGDETLFNRHKNNNNNSNNNRRLYFNPPFAIHSLHNNNNKTLMNRHLHSHLIKYNKSNNNNNDNNSSGNDEENIEEIKEKFKINTRIQFKGFKSEENPANSYHESPEKGAKGRIIFTFEDNAKKIGIRFDNKIRRGGNLGGLCEKGFGAILDVAEVELEKVYSGPPSSLVSFAFILFLLLLF